MTQPAPTAALLEAMTDRAKFEVLATSILRKAEPLYAPIIHTGVNASGETIKSPLDGFHLLPHSSPPHFVLVQHTTTDRSGLRGKWLSGANADLTKAIAEAVTVRRQIPDARFTLVLCTNQRVDLDLARDVTAAAAAADMAIDPWFQDRLADFLDTTADGHWLRKHYFGVEAVRLSEDLLRDICRRSIEAYSRSFLPVEQHLIRREAVGELLRCASDSTVTLCFLSARSGYGKSIAALQALEERHSDGGFALWLPPEWVQDAALLETALDGWLRHLHPSLEQGAGRVALHLASQGHRLVVVVDDVSRMMDPIKTLRAIAGHTAPPRSNDGTSGTGSTGKTTASSAAVAVVPIWPEWVQHVQQQLREADWVQTLSVGELNAADGVELVHGAVSSICREEAAGYVERLGYDPFNVGLFAAMCRGESDPARLGPLAADVGGEFINAHLREAAANNPRGLLFAELREELHRLGEEMLLRRNLAPRWQEVGEWFASSPQTIEALRAIVRREHIARIDGGGLVFRHDRLRERILVDAMGRLLRRLSPPEDVIADPYFAGITGQALARADDLPGWPARLRASCPLALFEAIRYFRVSRNKHQREIVDEAMRWSSAEYSAALPSLRWAISWALLETDSPLVVPLVEATGRNHILALAGLRNGSAKLGLGFFDRGPNSDFEPGREDQLRDRIVRIAVSRHRARLAQELQELAAADPLPKEPPAMSPMISGCIPQVVFQNSIPKERPDLLLTVMGHLALGGFDEAIPRLWSFNRDQLLPYALWAACRCPLADAAAILNPLLDRLAALPQRADFTKPLCEREVILQGLHWAFRRGVTPQAVSHLIGRARRGDALEKDIL